MRRKPEYVEHRSRASSRSPDRRGSSVLDLLHLSSLLSPIAWYLISCSRFLAGLHAREQTVEPLEITLPDVPVSFDPHLKLLQRRWTQCIDSALSVHANVY